jgi:hypothetical protein
MIFGGTLLEKIKVKMNLKVGHIGGNDKNMTMETTQKNGRT